MRSAFSSSSEEDEKAFSSSSEEDENLMDEDMETSRFRHELEAESQHVLQEQDEMMETVRRATERAEQSERIAHELREQVRSKSQMLLIDLKSMKNAVEDFSHEFSEGYEAPHDTNASSIASSRPSSPLEESEDAVQTQASSRPSSPLEGGEDEVHTQASSRPSSPLEGEEGEENGGSICQKAIIHTDSEIEQIKKEMQGHIAELVVARSEQQEEIEDLKSQVSRLEELWKESAMRVQRHKDRENERERAEIEVQDKIETLEAQGATYLDKLVQAQGQVKELTNKLHMVCVERNHLAQMLDLGQRTEHRNELAQSASAAAEQIKEGSDAISAEIELRHAQRRRALQEEMEETRRKHAADLEMMNAQHDEAMKEVRAAADANLRAVGLARALKEAENEERALKKAHQERLEELKVGLERQLCEFTEEEESRVEKLRLEVIEEKQRQFEQLSERGAGGREQAEREQEEVKERLINDQVTSVQTALELLHPYIRHIMSQSRQIPTTRTQGRKLSEKQGQDKIQIEIVQDKTFAKFGVTEVIHVSELESVNRRGTVGSSDGGDLSSRRGNVSWSDKLQHGYDHRREKVASQLPSPGMSSQSSKNSQNSPSSLHAQPAMEVPTSLRSGPYRELPLESEFAIFQNTSQSTSQVSDCKERGWAWITGNEKGICKNVGAYKCQKSWKSEKSVKIVDDQRVKVLLKKCVVLQQQVQDYRHNLNKVQQLFASQEQEIAVLREMLEGSRSLMRDLHAERERERELERKREQERQREREREERERDAEKAREIERENRREAERKREKEREEEIEKERVKRMGEVGQKAVICIFTQTDPQEPRDAHTGQAISSQHAIPHLKVPPLPIPPSKDTFREPSPRILHIRGGNPGLKSGLIAEGELEALQQMLVVKEKELQRRDSEIILLEHQLKIAQSNASQLDEDEAGRGSERQNAQKTQAEAFILCKWLQKELESKEIELVALRDIIAEKQNAEKSRFHQMLKAQVERDEKEDDSLEASKTNEDVGVVRGDAGEIMESQLRELRAELCMLQERNRIASNNYTTAQVQIKSLQSQLDTYRQICLTTLAEPQQPAPSTVVMPHTLVDADFDLNSDKLQWQVTTATPQVTIKKTQPDASSLPPTLPAQIPVSIKEEIVTLKNLLKTKEQDAARANAQQQGVLDKVLAVHRSQREEWEYTSRVQRQDFEREQETTRRWHKRTRVIALKLQKVSARAQVAMVFVVWLQIRRSAAEARNLERKNELRFKEMEQDHKREIAQVRKENEDLCQKQEKRVLAALVSAQAESKTSNKMRQLLAEKEQELKDKEEALSEMRQETERLVEVQQAQKQSDDEGGKRVERKTPDLQKELESKEVELAALRDFIAKMRGAENIRFHEMHKARVEHDEQEGDSLELVNTSHGGGGIERGGGWSSAERRGGNKSFGGEEEAALLLDLSCRSVSQECEAERVGRGENSQEHLLLGGGAKASFHGGGSGAGAQEKVGQVGLLDALSLATSKRAALEGQLAAAQSANRGLYLEIDSLNHILEAGLARERCKYGQNPGGMVVNKIGCGKAGDGEHDTQGAMQTVFDITTCQSASTAGGTDCGDILGLRTKVLQLLSERQRDLEGRTRVAGLEIVDGVENIKEQANSVCGSMGCSKGDLETPQRRINAPLKSSTNLIATTPASKSTRKNAATSAHFPPAKPCASTHARSTQTAADAEDLTHIADAGINKGKGRASVPQYTQGAARIVAKSLGDMQVILKTLRQEIVQKDEIIAQLTQRLSQAALNNEIVQKDEIIAHLTQRLSKAALNHQVDSPTAAADATGEKRAAAAAALNIIQALRQEIVLQNEKNAELKKIAELKQKAGAASVRESLRDDVSRLLADVSALMEDAFEVLIFFSQVTKNAILQSKSLNDVMKSNILEKDREEEDTPQTMRELMEGVNQRDSDIDKLEMQIECKDLAVKDLNVEIQRLKERLKMACDTSIASLRESKRIAEAKNQEVLELNRQLAALRKDNKAQAQEVLEINRLLAALRKDNEAQAQHFKKDKQEMEAKLLDAVEAVNRMQHTQHQMQEQLQRKDDDIQSLSNMVQSHVRQVNHHQQQQKEGEVGNADASAPDKDKEPSTMEILWKTKCGMMEQESEVLRTTIDMLRQQLFNITSQEDVL